MTSPPSSAEIALTRDTAFAALQAAQTALNAAALAHEDFRIRRWLTTPRRHRAGLAPLKQELAADLARARAARDELLCAPITLATLSPRQREQATHLTRQGRRRIERAASVPATHPAYAHAQTPGADHDR